MTEPRDPERDLMPVEDLRQLVREQAAEIERLHARLTAAEEAGRRARRERDALGWARLLERVRNDRMRGMRAATLNARKAPAAEARRQLILELHARNETIETIAKDAKCSVRWVYAILEDAAQEASWRPPEAGNT